MAARTPGGVAQRGEVTVGEVDDVDVVTHAGAVRSRIVRAEYAEVIAAPDRQSLVTRTRALDRALQWSFLVVPHWHTRADRVAYWDRFGRPAVTPRVGYLPSVWWVDPAKDAALRDRRAQTR